MRPTTTPLLLLAAITALSSCGARSARRDRAQSDHQTLSFDGRDRTYLLRLPPAITQSSAVIPSERSESRDLHPRRALVIVLHGGGGNGLNAETMTGFTEKGKAEGFIVVYPDGTGRRRDALLTWNAGHCCGEAMQSHVNDVGFIGALIDDLSARYPVDRNRVYVTGMSNGAMMSHRVGIELSGKIAAIAPVVGAVFGDEPRPHTPVSAIMINGLLDESVPVNGGSTGGRFGSAWDGTPTRPASEQGRFWAAADGCNATPHDVDTGVYLMSRYDCPKSLAVESYVVKDNGHAWPGGKRGSRMGNAPSTAMNATDVIWAFFKAHPKL
jgi:polyhydroxybutyrate depolymerase